MRYSFGIAVAIAIGSSARAQACDRRPATYYEFQVDNKAAYLADSAWVFRPTEDLDRAAEINGRMLIVGLVVDTAGVPIPSSARLPIGIDSISALRIRDAMERWRYQPASVKGCKVQQFVQTPVAVRR